MAEHPGMTAAGGAEPDTARWLAGMGRALSDPARARILLLLAQGRACCEGLERQAPAETGDGVCVCELEEVLGLRQSLVSYHLRLLKEAGLVRETRCGRWSYYSLDREAVEQLAGMLSALARIPPSQPEGRSPVAGPGADPDGKEVTGMAGTPDPREGRLGGQDGGAAAPAAAGRSGEESCCEDARGQLAECCGGEAVPTCCE